MRPVLPRVNALLVIVTLTWTSSSHGGSNAAPTASACSGASRTTTGGPSEQLSDVTEEEASDRVWAIQRTLDAESSSASRWTMLWGAGGLALSAGNFAMAAFTSNRADRADDIVGGSTSLLIPVLLMVSPPRAIESALALRRASSVHDTNSCALLAVAEHELEQTAADDRFKAGVVAHSAVIGFSVAVGLVLGLGYHHWRGAVVNGVGGVVISEAEILTRPHDSVRAWARYKAGGPILLPDPHVSWRLTPWAGRDGGGVQLIATF